MVTVIIPPLRSGSEVTPFLDDYTVKHMSPF